jgi:hypothetical protein
MEPQLSLTEGHDRRCRSHLIIKLQSSKVEGNVKIGAKREARASRPHPSEDPMRHNATEMVDHDKVELA